MNKWMIFATLTLFLIPLALGGCSSTPNADSSSSGKSKAGYEKKSGGYSSGY